MSTRQRVHDYLEGFDPMEGFCVHITDEDVWHIPGPFTMEQVNEMRMNRKQMFLDIRAMKQREVREARERIDARTAEILEVARRNKRNGVASFAFEMPYEPVLENVPTHFSYTGEDWPFIEEHVTCPSCGKKPCEWLSYQNKAAAYAKKNLLDNRGMTREQIKSYQSDQRKNLFMMCNLVRYGQGTLGWGVRVKFPPCVEKHVRALFPSPDGQYTGFREE